jgi:hypothetical protein
MTRHRFLLALTMTTGLAMPGAALAGDNDDANPILRGFVSPQYHAPSWDRDDDDYRWGHSYRISRDDDDGRWDDDDHDDDRWDNDDDD